MVGKSHPQMLPQSFHATRHVRHRRTFLWGGGGDSADRPLRKAGGWLMWTHGGICGHMAVCQNLVPLVNIKIAGKWMFIPLKMVLIGIDPYPYVDIWSSKCQLTESNDHVVNNMGKPLLPLLGMILLASHLIMVMLGDGFFSIGEWWCWVFNHQNMGMLLGGIGGLFYDAIQYIGDCLNPWTNPVLKQAV